MILRIQNRFSMGIIYNNSLGYKHDGYHFQFNLIFPEYKMSPSTLAIWPYYSPNLKIAIVKEAELYKKGRESIRHAISGKSVFKLSNWDPTKEIFTSEKKDINIKLTPEKTLHWTFLFHTENTQKISKIELKMSKAQFTLLKFTIQSGWEEILGEKDAKNAFFERISRAPTYENI